MMYEDLPDVLPTSLVSLRGGMGALLLLWLCAACPFVAHAQPAELLVESNVAEATVWIEGEQVARTNADGQVLLSALAPGQYTVQVRRPGYWSASSRVTLEPDLTTRVTLTLMPRPGGAGGNLLVRTNVSDAVVLVDGEQVGQTGPNGRAFATGLTAGPHRVVVRKSGYVPARRTVVFDESGLDRSVQLRLLPGQPSPTGSPLAADTNAEELPEPVITAGAGTPADSGEAVPQPDSSTWAPSRFVVDAGVAGAQVVLNDSVSGRTGSAGRLAVAAAPGTHQIAVRKEGYATAQTTARLAAGERRPVSLSLEPAPSADETAPLARIGDNLLVLFFVSLVGVAGVVALMIGIAGWKGGVFFRWFRDTTHFDRYDVSEVLRRSETATVYLANDPNANRRVALKVLDDPYADKPEHVQQFLDRGRTLQRIQEAAPEAPVIAVYRVGRKNDAEDGRPFVALEHLEGETLLSYVKDVGKLSPQAAVSVIRQVCLGLQAAHGIDVHHGALTPENIIVTQTEPSVTIRLTGFGLDTSDPSTQVLTDRIAGSSAAYFAPEQLRRGEGDWRADIYSVGMLFYKLVTGAPPYAGVSTARLREGKGKTDPPDLPDDVPEHVKPVFYRMVSDDPDRRPTAARVVSILDLIGSSP
jgi:hypothetical protein